MAKYKLGDICEIVSGSTPKSEVAEYWDGDIKWITPAELNEDSYIVSDSVRKITQLGVQKTGLTPFPAGTVILSSRAPIGKVAIAGCEMYCNQGFKNLICSSVIDSRYLYWFLKGKTAYLNSLGRGATFKEISKQIVASIEIEVPSLEQQIAIVQLLERINEIMNGRKQELRTLDTLIKARFVEMFGEITDYVNITEIAHTYIGLVTTMTTHYCDKGTPLLFNSSIKADRIVWDGTCLDSEFSELNKGRMHQTYDILTVHTGDIGTSAVIGEELNKSLGFATIVTRINERNKYNPRYISSFLNYGSGKEQLSKYSRDVRNNLNLKDFNRLMVPNASISAQNEYDDFVKQVDKSKVVVQEALDKAQLLFNSLMQQYFG